MATATKAQQSEREAARERLRELLPPGSTVYAKVCHVSRSGMMRVVNLSTIQETRPIYIDGLACRATERPYNRRHDGVEIGGCGTDV